MVRKLLLNRSKLLEISGFWEIKFLLFLLFPEFFPNWYFKKQYHLKVQPFQTYLQETHINNIFQ